MYFDFEDYRPDTPRIPTAISIREAVLASVVVHLLFVIAYLVIPEEWYERAEVLEAEAVMPADPDREPPLRFVEVMPLRDRPEQPVRPADQSDLDRRSRTRERPTDAIDPLPFMQGNTPELVEGGPPAAPPAPPPAPAPAPPQVADSSPLSSSDEGFATVPPQPSPEGAPQTARALGDSLRDLQQYLRQENFDNPRGGNTEQSADIQFDSMGIDFGPWLRRFKNQVERNWLVPQAAMSFRGRVVIRFNVLRNGYITDLEVLQPASIPALTNAALNALRLSNPTAQLPLEYPAEKVLFTVTFYYNEDPRSSP
jgi:TonB family protein